MATGYDVRTSSDAVSNSPRPYDQAEMTVTLSVVLETISSGRQDTLAWHPWSQAHPILPGTRKAQTSCIRIIRMHRRSAMMRSSTISTSGSLPRPKPTPSWVLTLCKTQARSGGPLPLLRARAGGPSKTKRPWVSWSIRRGLHLGIGTGLSRIPGGASGVRLSLVGQLSVSGAALFADQLFARPEKVQRPDEQRTIRSSRCLRGPEGRPPLPTPVQPIAALRHAPARGEPGRGGSAHSGPPDLTAPPAPDRSGPRRAA